MINYKVRPALLTKAILEKCYEINFSMPDEFNRFMLLEDHDLISMHMITCTLKTIENNTLNDTFYYDFINVIEDRWIGFFEKIMKDSTSPCDKLVNFFNIYPGKFSSVDWTLHEDMTTLTLTAKRMKEKNSCKFDDLMLFNFISKLLSSSYNFDYRSLSVKLPFQRRFYGKYIDIFHNVSFEENDMSITINKSRHDIKNSKSFISPKYEITLYSQVLAAANMIPIEDLDLISLSFVLNISPRTLQRKLQKSGLSTKEIITDVKYNRAVSVLLKNNYNLKKTYLDCGYTNSNQLTRIFLNKNNMTPRDYVKMRKSILLFNKI